MRSVLLATSFPPAIGGMETLLYQTSRHLVEPPLVLAPDVRRGGRPARGPGWGCPLVQRLAYRPLWLAASVAALPCALLAASASAASSAGDRGCIQAGHVYLAPLARLLARRLRCPYVVYAYGQEVWRDGRRMGIARLDAELRGAGAARRRLRCCRPATSRARCSTTGTCRPSASCVCRTARSPRPDSRAAVRDDPAVGGVDSSRAKASTPSSARCRGWIAVGRVPRRRARARTRRVCAQSGGHGRRVPSACTSWGGWTTPTLADEYRRCAAFVQPSRRTDDGQLEGYGLVYFEAAAWGRPVIAGRSGGEVDAVVDGRTGADCRRPVSRHGGGGHPQHCSRIPIACRRSAPPAGAASRPATTGPTPPPLSIAACGGWCDLAARGASGRWTWRSAGVAPEAAGRARSRRTFGPSALFTEAGVAADVRGQRRVSRRSSSPTGGAFFYSAHARLAPRGLARFIRTFPGAVQTRARRASPTPPGAPAPEYERAAGLGGRRTPRARARRMGGARSPRPQSRPADVAREFHPAPCQNGCGHFQRRASVFRRSRLDQGRAQRGRPERVPTRPEAVDARR